MSLSKTTTLESSSEPGVEASFSLPGSLESFFFFFLILSASLAFSPIF